MVTRVNAQSGDVAQQYGPWQDAASKFFFVLFMQLVANLRHCALLFVLASETSELRPATETHERT